MAYSEITKLNMTRKDRFIDPFQHLVKFTCLLLFLYEKHNYLKVFFFKSFCWKCHIKSTTCSVQAQGTDPE